MRYCVQCNACREQVWIRGSYDYSVNALELKDDDPRWSEACEHIQAGGDYEIVDEEVMEDAT